MSSHLGACVLTHLFRAHEQQMLDGMGHARHVVGIAKAPHFHVDTGASLVGVRIVHEQSVELIWQSNDSVGAIVEFWSLELVGNPLNGDHGCKGLADGGRSWGDCRRPCNGGTSNAVKGG